MAGFILWEGASKCDAKPIVVIATGFGRKSANAKTGAMIQTWIQRARVDPTRAVFTGADASVCGACKLRGRNGRDRTCYVRVNHAPYAIYHAFRRGSYPRISLRDATELCAGRKIRLGAYGDPAVVPIGVWHAIVKRAAGCTGYTHQWREHWCAAGLRRYVMASTETDAETTAAHELGWRTFRVRRADESLRPDEIVCPASAEAGKRLTCETCLACNGGRIGKRSVAILPHGSFAIATRLLACNRGIWRVKPMPEFQIHYSTMYRPGCREYAMPHPVPITDTDPAAARAHFERIFRACFGNTSHYRITRIEQPEEVQA